jgi:Domain of unknown function (DUF4390)
MMLLHTPLRRQQALSQGLGWYTLALVWLGMIGVISGAHADEPQTPFDVRSAYVEPSERGYVLNVTLDVGLTKAAEEAVRDGVPLKVTLDIQMNRKRRFFIDKKLEDRSVAFGLRYDAIADRFIVKGSGETSASQAFSTLPEALAALGKIDNIHIFDKERVRPTDDIEGSVRANVIVEAGSSTVMRYLMFWIDWRRSTDWYTWHVKP